MVNLTSRSFEEAFESLYGETNSSDPWTQSTGSTFSYTSLCKNGNADRKFGLVEAYSDYRIVMKVYDGEICAERPNQYWQGKQKEMDITIPRKHPIMQKINSVFLEAQTMLQKKGAKIDAQVPPSLKPSFRKFRPY